MFYYPNIIYDAVSNKNNFNTLTLVNRVVMLSAESNTAEEVFRLVEWYLFCGSEQELVRVLDVPIFGLEAEIVRQDRTCCF